MGYELAVDADADRSWGRFIKSPPQVSLNPDGRSLTLLRQFAYADPSGIRWDAPKGSVVDGASIPRLMWTAVGGPLEGKYRNASIVHDVACVSRNREWQLVHRAFYNAMRLSKVSSFRAKLMYAAVYHFGPRWIIRDRGKVDPVPARPPMTETDLRAFETKLVIPGPSHEAAAALDSDGEFEYDPAYDSGAQEMDLEGIEEMVPPSIAAAARRRRRKT